MGYNIVADNTDLFSFV